MKHKNQKETNRIQKENTDHVHKNKEDENQEKKLREQPFALDQHFKTIYHLVPEPIVITTLEDFKILEYNDAVYKISGYTIEDMSKNINESQYLYTYDVEKRTIVSQLLKEKGFIENLEVKFLSKDKGVLEFLVSANVYQANGVSLVIHVMRDITALKSYEKTIKTREKQLALIFENSPIGMFQFDVNGRIINVNPCLCKTIGSTKDKLLNINMLELPNYKYVETAKKALQGEQAIFEDFYEFTVSGKKAFIQATFTPMLDEEGRVSGGIGIIEDFTQRKLLEEEIRKLSITDKLTQLFNRMKIDEELDIEVERSKRSELPFGVIMYDIDNFKRINDDYGHQIGDSTLIELSELIRTNIREIDILGRWGGEEFLLITPHTDMFGAMTLAEKLRKYIEEHEFPNIKKLTCSFGVSVWGKGDNASTLISRSDEALYVAKRNGRNRVEKRST